MRNFTLKTLILTVLGLIGVYGVSVQAQTWTRTSLSDATGKNVYLYNLGTKKFLGKGGHWGTQATLASEGVLFTLTETSKGAGTYYLTSHLQQQDGTVNGKLTFTSENSSFYDKNGVFYVDQTHNYLANLIFTEVSGESNVYNISVAETDTLSTYIGINYMVAQDNGITNSKDASMEATDDAAKWILVTEDTRNAAFQNDSNIEDVTATFLIKDFDFGRRDLNVDNWKTSDGKALTWNEKNGKPSDAYPTTTVTTTTTYVYMANHKHSSQTCEQTISLSEYKGESCDTTCSIGRQKSYAFNYSHAESNTTSTTTEGYTYYNGNGYDANSEITDESTSKTVRAQYLYGGKWTANIHGSAGTLYQTISSDNMLRKGWYTVYCKAFTTATKGTVKLVVTPADALNLESTHTRTADVVKFNGETIPTTYVEASDSLAADDYLISAQVYVDETNGTYNPLTFGIYVDGADEKAWTCFDDFELKYNGDAPMILLLDEESESSDYLEAQRYEYEGDKTGEDYYKGNRVLYLHRTFNLNKWNTLVLPVDITVGQARNAFGSDVKISEFFGAIDEDRPGTIIFKNITTTETNDIAIKANKLYLIKPTVAEPGADGATTIDTVSKTCTYNGKEINISLDKYYTFPAVQYNYFDEGTLNTRPDCSESVAEYYGTDGKIKAVGTYLNVTAKNGIPVNSYVLSGKSTDNSVAGLWYYRTAKTKSKGFRGWLETVTTEGQASTGLDYEINGIVEHVAGDPTGIGEILLNPNTVNGNVYNLNGQLIRRNATSLDGLAAGVYVSNGKKYVVK